MILSILYLLTGAFVCKMYVEANPEKTTKRKPVNMNTRIAKRLSIILFYPVLLVFIGIMLFVELLTEDEPFS